MLKMAFILGNFSLGASVILSCVFKWRWRQQQSLTSSGGACTCIRGQLGPSQRPVGDDGEVAQELRHPAVPGKLGRT